MGIIFKIPAFITFAVSGLWGALLSLGIVVDNLGFIGGVIAFVLFPAALTFAPIYDGFANSNWMTFIIVYGGMAAAALLYFFGYLIDGE